jgi:hypothetical protein
VIDSAVLTWTLTMPAGSQVQRNFSFTVPGTGLPYGTSGLTWEYVARPTATDLTSPGLITVTTTPSSQGVITVLSTTATPQLLLTLYPAATVSLAPQQYFHTLWSGQGTSSAFTWVTGNLIIAGNPQP